MKSTLISAAVMALVLAACNKESTPPAQPVPPAPKAAPVTPSPAPSGELTQEQKEKVAKDAIDAAKSSARKGE